MFSFVHQLAQRQIMHQPCRNLPGRFDTIKDHIIQIIYKPYAMDELLSAAT